MLGRILNCHQPVLCERITSQAPTDLKDTDLKDFRGLALGHRRPLLIFHDPDANRSGPWRARDRAFVRHWLSPPAGPLRNPWPASNLFALHAADLPHPKRRRLTRIVVEDAMADKTYQYHQNLYILDNSHAYRLEVER